MKALSPDDGKKGAPRTTIWLSAQHYAGHMTLVSKPRIHAILSKSNR